MTEEHDYPAPSLPVYPSPGDIKGTTMVLDRDRSGPLMKMLSSRMTRTLKGLTVPQKVKIHHKQAIKRNKKKTAYW